MPPLHVTEHTVKTGAHTTFFLASGPEDGPLIHWLHPRIIMTLHFLIYLTFDKYHTKSSRSIPPVFQM